MVTSADASERPAVRLSARCRHHAFRVAMRVPAEHQRSRSRTRQGMACKIRSQLLGLDSRTQIAQRERRAVVEGLFCRLSKRCVLIGNPGFVQTFLHFRGPSAWSAPERHLCGDDRHWRSRPGIFRRRIYPAAHSSAMPQMKLAIQFRYRWPWLL